jgi:hypothetical protein
MIVEAVAWNKYSFRYIFTVYFHLQLLKPFLYEKRLMSPEELAIAEHDE